MNSYHQRIATYAETLQNQIYILQGERGHHFARSMGLTVNQALALTALELAKLLNQ